MKIYERSAASRRAVPGNSLRFNEAWHVFMIRRQYLWLRRAGTPAETARHAIWTVAWLAKMDRPTFVTADGTERS